MKKVLVVTGNIIRGLNKVMKYDDLNNIEFLDYVEAMFICVQKYINEGYTHFICGGAIGVDMDFAELIIFLKENYNLNDLFLEIAVPCKDQCKKWSYKFIEKYKCIIDKADLVTFVSDQEYSFNCMMKRNQYMVDKATTLLAFWNGERGGTYNTILYAKKQRKNVEIIDLRNL